MASNPGDGERRAAIRAMSYLAALVRDHGEVTITAIARGGTASETEVAYEARIGDGERVTASTIELALARLWSGDTDPEVRRG